MNKMTRNRYNLFNQIHKGMRAMLYSTAMDLQHNDFRDRDQTCKVFEKISELLWICTDHSIQENKFVLSVISIYDLQMVAEFEGEHLAIESMAHRLKNLMAMYNYAVCNDEKLEAGDAVFKAFNEFIAFNMHHMNKEAEKLNEILWQHYSDKEFFCIYNAITASIPLDKVAANGRWVMREINNSEIINWLSTYQGAQPRAFQFLLQIAEDELPEERWNKIKEALCDGEMWPC